MSSSQDGMAWRARDTVPAEDARGEIGGKMLTCAVDHRHASARAQRNGADNEARDSWQWMSSHITGS